MIKAIVRSTLAIGCRVTGQLAATERGNRDALTILCFHRILPADAKNGYFMPDLAVTPSAFSAYCRTLKEYYHVLPLNEAVRMWTEGQTSDRPLAAITFDDGYRDNYRYAVPILAEYGLRATFFIVAGLVGEPQPPWYDRLARAWKSIETKGLSDKNLIDAGLNEPLVDYLSKQNHGRTAYALVAMAKTLSPAERSRLVQKCEQLADIPQAWPHDDLIMDWAQLSALVAGDHEIGSHSYNHELLPQLDDEALHQEIARSKDFLQKNIGHPVETFCYPNGDADQRVSAAVSKAGYTCAVTMQPGLNRPDRPPFMLKRWFIHEDRLKCPAGRASSIMLRMEISGLADRIFGRKRK